MEYKAILANAKKIEELLRKGYSNEKIMREVKDFSGELLSIARARIENAKNRKLNPWFVFNEDDLRFATNEDVADYRAKRLRCNTIVDIGCGIGIQAIAFAKNCKKVIAIDIDSKKIAYARINAEVSKAKNIEFIEGDALEVLDKISKADIVFWDPERPPEEKVRSLGSFKPSFEELMKKAGKLTEKIAIELPPQISIKEDCEKEYISLNNSLNRLTGYFGPLKKCDISVVHLPSGEKLEHSGEIKELKESSIKKYLFEIDKAVLKAKLQFLLGDDAVTIGDAEYITSDEMIKNPFLIPFEVLGVVKKSELKDFLKKKNCGKAVLRGKIPEKEYWKLRKELESGLNGTRIANVFLGNEIIVAAKV